MRTKRKAIAIIKGDHVLIREQPPLRQMQFSEATGFAAANDLVGKTDDEIREAIGDKFPKHVYHSIVCIGALVAHKERDYWAIDADGAPHVGERTEKQLISAFVDKIAELYPQLVTFNG